jgi:hypothetical protein
VFSGLV